MVFSSKCRDFLSVRAVEIASAGLSGSEYCPILGCILDVSEKSSRNRAVGCCEVRENRSSLMLNVSEAYEQMGRTAAVLSSLQLLVLRTDIWGL